MNLNRIENRIRRVAGGAYDASRLRSLPMTLEYTGEFGLELLLFLPFVTWLSHAGLLRSRKIKTYRGMSSFYSGLDCKAFIEKDDQRVFVPPGDRLPYLPVKSEHDFDGLGRSPFHLYPDLRRKFASLPLPSAFEARLRERPLLVIHNKHTDEWNSGPVNHMSLDVLDRLFSQFEKDFTVVYIRHGIRAPAHGYVGDENSIVPFDDLGLLEKHPEIILFDDLFDLHRSEIGDGDLNAFKNALCSRAYRFITSQGGGAHHLAYFSGSAMAILHRKGPEEELAYSDGYYGFLANPAPIRLVCRNETELLDAASVMVGSEVADGRILAPAGAAPIVRRYSPWTLAARGA